MACLGFSQTMAYGGSNNIMKDRNKVMALSKLDPTPSLFAATRMITSSRSKPFVMKLKLFRSMPKSDKAKRVLRRFCRNIMSCIISDFMNIKGKLFNAELFKEHFLWMAE
jgi:hypothetical protein